MKIFKEILNEITQITPIEDMFLMYQSHKKPIKTNVRIFIFILIFIFVFILLAKVVGVINDDMEKYAMKLMDDFFSSQLFFIFLLITVLLEIIFVKILKVEKIGLIEFFVNTPRKILVGLTISSVAVCLGVSASMFITGELTYIGFSFLNFSGILLSILAMYFVFSYCLVTVPCLSERRVKIFFLISLLVNIIFGLYLYLMDFSGIMVFFFGLMVVCFIGYKESPLNCDVK